MVYLTYSEVTELIETLSAQKHEEWVEWMKHFFSKMIVIGYDELNAFKTEEDDGMQYDVSGENPIMENILIEREVFYKWKAYMEAEYSELSEEEKASFLFSRKMLETVGDRLGIEFEFEKMKIKHHTSTSVICNKCKTVYRCVEGTSPPLNDRGLCTFCSLSESIQ